MNRPRPFLLVLSLTLCCVSGCAALLSALEGEVARPTLTVRSVDITRVSLAGISANVVCDVNNPNAFALDLGTFAYQLSLDGHQLVAGRNDHGFNIPAGGTGTVAFPVEFRFTEVGGAVMSLFQKDQVPYAVQTTLGFNTPVGIIQVPLAHQGTFPVPKLPAISLAGAKAGDISFTGATLRVSLALGNRNNFAVPLGSFSYHIQVEGQDVSTGGVAAPELAANATHSLEIPIHINFFNMGAAVVGAVSSGQARVKVMGGLALPGLGQSLPFAQEAVLPLR